MRLDSYLATLILAVTSAYASAGTARNHFLRQDVSQTSQSAISTSVATSSSGAESTTAPGTSASTFFPTTPPSSSSIATSTLPSSSQVIQVTTSTASVTGPSATATQGPSSADVLPLRPRISPAVGIIGVILLVAGLALTSIGIKHEWLHVFLSTSLLAALAVTALVVYVMNPPVSDAVQGAYFVAAFMTGIIIGGISLIFREITEGLACLLGGFCLAMWLLVLQPGGLIKNQTGRGILIGVFCAVAWAFSFPKFTRDPALIFCTSFAGATITILGIDCFSRAGLKEFWIYIWNLNDNEFPIGTTTYPMSRGIKVEVAGIVILTLFGLLSQVKIWKIINKRRGVRDAVQLRDNEDRENAEQRIAQRVQRYNERYLKLWEAAYSKSPDKSSGVQVQEHALENFPNASNPTQNNALPKRLSRNVTTSASSLGVNSSSERRDHRYKNFSRQSKEDMKHVSRSISPASSRLSVPLPRSQSSTEKLIYHPVMEKRSSTRNSLVPDVISLPFKASSRPASRVLSSRRTTARESQLYAVNNDVVVMNPSRRTSARESQLYAVNNDAVIMNPSRAPTPATANRTSLNSLNGVAPSTIAATCDDIADFDTLSQHRLSYLQVSAAGSRAGSAAGSSNNRASFIEDPVDEHDDEVIYRLEQKPDGNQELKVDRQQSRLSVSEQNRLSTHSSAPDDKQAISQLTSDVLSAHAENRVSLIATTHRTNEWAKHITEAEKPLEEDDIRATLGIEGDSGFAEEAARPVDVDALSSRPTSSHAGIGIRRASSQVHINKDYNDAHTKLVRRLSSTAETTERTSTQHRPLSRRHSRLSEHSYDGEASSSAGRQPVRSVSDQPPPLPPLARRLTAEGFDLSMIYKRPDLHLIAPSDTASLAPVRAKTPERSSSALVRRESSTRIAARSRSRPSSRAQGVEHSQVTAPLVQGFQGTSTQNSRPKTAGSQQPSRMSSVNERPHTAGRSSMIYDSHQPKRHNSIDPERQAELQALWRQSLQNSSIHGASPFVTPDAAHATMLNERRQAEWRQQQEQAERAGRQSAIDMAMRSGQMQTAHRDAMRKMQARAKSQPRE